MANGSPGQAGPLSDPDWTRADLTAQIEARIEFRLPNRISNLHVTNSGELIVLRGRARSYHDKQLAQEAALDHIGGTLRLSNQIEVG